jgi:polysaccharide biosynthesis transport protein
MAFLDFLGGKKATAIAAAQQWDAALAATRQEVPPVRDGMPRSTRAAPTRVVAAPRASAENRAADRSATTSNMAASPTARQQFDNFQSGEEFTNPQFESLRTIAGAILRRWPLLLMSMLTALLLAILFLLVVTPRYISTAKILLDSQPKRVVDGAVVQSGLGSSAAGADTLLVDSQVELIQSATVLRRIIDTEKLKDDPEFAVPHGGGLRIMLRNSLGRLFGNEREFAPETNPDDIALWRFTDKHLRVRRDGNTYTIQVAVMSENPAKAARLANAVAQAYVKEGVQSASETTRAATGDLDSRIADLRNRVQKAENEVESWKSKNGLIGVPGLLLTEQQMSQLNDKLGLARAATAIAKARYDQVKDLSARSGGAALGAQSDALKSPVIANLRQSLSRIERAEAVIQQTLRPGHPDYAKVATEKRSLLAQLDDELNRIKANAKAEFELSQANERATADELKAAEGRTNTGNQAQVRLRDLQRTLESERSVYQQFLNRANETREQADLNRPTSRIISPATVAPFPSFPPTMLTILGSLGGGLLLGAGLAWLQHLMHGSGPLTRALPDMQPAQRVTSSTAWSERNTSRDTSAWQPRSMPSRQTADRPEVTFKPDKPEPIMAPTSGSSQLTARLRANAGLPDGTTTNLRAAALRRHPSQDLPQIPQLNIAKRAHGIALPSPGSYARITFTDHLTAVEAARPHTQAGYRSAIDQLLSTLAQFATVGMPLIVVVGGTDVGVGTSSTALSLAYRAATTGTRTLLIDACSADAHLSQQLAQSMQPQRSSLPDNEEQLAEITMLDERTGLSLLPLAFNDLEQADANQQACLLSGLRKLSSRFELVLIDVGAASTNRGAVFLGALAERMLIVTHDGVDDPLLTAANFGVSLELASVVTTDTH